jgi:hypothetical protein
MILFRPEFKFQFIHNALRNSIVLELRGTPTGYLEPSPFYWGTPELDIVFELSQDHTPDLASCPEAHGCTLIKRYVLRCNKDEHIGAPKHMMSC